MPLYEYVCEQDGTVVEALRPMKDADKPLPDPAGKGRVFKRQQSTFAAKGAAGAAPGSAGGGCCPCGKNPGACNRA